MAERKLDLSEDLISAKSSNRSLTLKGSMGNDEDNVLADMLDDSKEYGTQGIVSTSSDVYSFGIVLLETFTRKKPTDEMFDEETSLKDWVNISLQKNTILEVVDTNFLKPEGQDFSSRERCVSSGDELFGHFTFSQDRNQGNCHQDRTDYSHVSSNYHKTVMNVLTFMWS